MGWMASVPRNCDFTAEGAKPFKSHIESSASRTQTRSRTWSRDRRRHPKQTGADPPNRKSSSSNYEKTQSELQVWWEYFTVKGRTQNGRLARPKYRMHLCSVLASYPRFGFSRNRTSAKHAAKSRGPACSKRCTHIDITPQRETNRNMRRCAAAAHCPPTKGLLWHASRAPGLALEAKTKR